MAAQRLAGRDGDVERVLLDRRTRPLPLAHILGDRQAPIERPSPWVESGRSAASSPTVSAWRKTVRSAFRPAQRNARDWWPRWLLKVLQQYYSATGERVIELMGPISVASYTSPRFPLGH